MFGSTLPHGFHASHFLSSFTCANTAEGGVFTVVLRATWNSPGRVATTTRRMTSRTARTATILISFDFMESGFFTVTYHISTSRRTEGPSRDKFLRQNYD